MSEPGLLAQGQAESGPSLWERAPGWRRLTVGASLLTLAAVAVPVLVPQPQNAAPPSVAAAAPAHQAVAMAAPPSAAQAPAAVPAQPGAANPAAACALALPSQAQFLGAGVVQGFENPRAAQARMLVNERLNGGSINPSFAATPRAVVRADGSAPGSPMQVVVLPPGMIVHPGDHIAYNSSYRDMSMPCGYIPPSATHDDGPAQSSVPPQPQIAGSQTAMADMPMGTVVVSPGVETRVNQHSRWAGPNNFPITITMLTPPAHGAVTTRQGMGPQRDTAGVMKIVPVTQIFYQSAPGYSGMDSFSYQRMSTDPRDPMNGKTVTVNIDVAGAAVHESASSGAPPAVRAMP